jgi:hypothetical protein
VAWSIDGNVASGSDDTTVKMWNSSTGECLKTLEGHSGLVEHVQFSHDGATLVSADNRETFFWNVATGARKDTVAGEQFAFAKAGVGRYIVTKKHDLVVVYDTRMGANDGADGEEKVLTALFRAPSPIVSVSCAGDKIAVGCQSGAVLTLHAAWLTDGGAA